MASTDDILNLVRVQMRRQKITYSALAKKLKLSESSIKRMFSRADMSLSRLQKICDLLGVDLADLAAQVIEERRTLTELTEAQEKALTEEPKFLLFAYLITRGWSFSDILSKYQFTPAEGTAMLVKLDRMKLIELMPENRVRLRISRDFSWRDNGPISRYFDREVQREFLKGDFSRPGSLKLVANGYVSPASLSALHQRMDRLIREFNEMSKRDGNQTKENLLPQRWSVRSDPGYFRVPEIRA